MSEKELLRRLSIQLEHIIDLLERKGNNTSKKMGRPSKEYLVRIYRNSYPNRRKMQCVRETGLSIKTVSKYWHKQEEKEMLYLEE